MQYQSECLSALKSVANIHKPFEKAFMDTMKLFMAIPDRINFLQLGRYGCFSEQTYRNLFEHETFDWFAFNGSIISKHLIAAEALLKQNNPDQAKARTYLETVRKRAFTVNGELNANYDLPATVTIEDVLTERLHELPLELKVWDDIRRNRLYPQLQADNSLKWVDIATAETYNKRDNKSFKDNLHMLLWPIPQSAMERNPNLTQNPGY